MTLGHVTARAWLISSMVLVACRSSTTTVGDERGDPLLGPPAPIDTTLIAGRSFNCQLTSTAEVECWGRNIPAGFDESFPPVTHLAIGSTRSVYDGRPEPVCARLADGGIVCEPAAPSVGAVRDVALSADRACAILEAGGIQCWELDGDEPMRMSRYQVAGALVLALAEDHACALTQGAGGVVCWGFDDCPPRHIPGFGIGVEIAARVDTCVVDNRGVVRCLAPTSCPDSTASPRTMPSLAGARRVGAGYDINCAASASAVACWPSSAASAATSRLAGVIERPGSSVIHELAVGVEHVCVRADADTIECWGSNRDHQLDPDAATTHVEDPRLVAGIEGAEQVVVGTRYSCARTATGSVSCWGAAWEASDTLPWTGQPQPRAQLQDAAIFVDPYGELGFVSPVGELDYWSPKASVAPGPFIVDEALAGGGRFRVERTLNDRTWVACVLADGARPSCQIAGQPTRAFDGARDVALCHDRAWLVDAEGVLTSLRLSKGGPVPRPNFDLRGSVAEVACCSYEVCARLEGGSVSCWSDARSPGPLYPTKPAPVALDGPSVGLTMGLRAACSWTAAGRVQCWGDRSAPSLAPLASVDFERPGTLTSIGDAAQVAIDFSHGCVLHTGGTVSCWGSNAVGQAGQASGAWRGRPTQASPAPTELSPRPAN